MSGCVHTTAPFFLPWCNTYLFFPCSRYNFNFFQIPLWPLLYVDFNRICVRCIWGMTLIHTHQTYTSSKAQAWGNAWEGRLPTVVIHPRNDMMSSLGDSSRKLKDQGRSSHIPKIFLLPPTWLHEQYEVIKRWVPRSWSIFPSFNTATCDILFLCKHLYRFQNNDKMRSSSFIPFFSIWM